MKTLAEAGEQARRRALMGADHMAPLDAMLAELRHLHGEVPNPDPADGGAFASLLVLLETPGPSVRATSFVSLDNPTGTSRNLTALLRGADIARSKVMVWNAVPWVIHHPGAANRAPRRSEIRAGLAHLPPLIRCMPDLAAIVLCGRTAAEAELLLRQERPGLPVLRMPHPSPTIQCTSPEVGDRCRAALRAAAEHLASTYRSAA